MGRIFRFRLYDRTQQGLMGNVPIGITRKKDIRHGDQCCVRNVNFIFFS